MAGVTAISLRNMARAAMLEAGGRGFVRFADGGALLVCDALRRCADEPARERLLGALAQAGFVCTQQDGLLYLMPGDGLIGRIEYGGACEMDWESPLCGVRAVGCRFLKKARAPLTDAGRELVVSSLKITWQDRAADGLAALCAQAAVMQRNRDTSGFYEAGAVLAAWCDMQEGKTHEA